MLTAVKIAAAICALILWSGFILPYIINAIHGFMLTVGMTLTIIGSIALLIYIVLQLRKPKAKSGPDHD